MAPETLRNSILEFLDSASARSQKQIYCWTCGTLLEYRNSTFFYDGRSWEITLPVCMKCHAAADLPYRFRPD
jgi:hypothetical protein